MHSTKPCQCEHAAHFERNKRTPRGNPGHKYGIVFDTIHLYKVKTDFGTFQVCSDCLVDCHNKGDDRGQRCINKTR